MKVKNESELSLVYVLPKRNYKCRKDEVITIFHIHIFF